jgi:hypothetical protein
MSAPTPDIAPGHAEDCVGRAGWSDGDNLFDYSNCTCSGPRDTLVTYALRVWANAVDKGNGSPTPDLLRRSANEIDRLRSVIENAPHASWCGWLNADRPAEESAACTCWKADAL